MRKYLESELLADSLRGRVRYNCTAYVGMDGCHVFEIYFDNKIFKRFSWETVNSYFLDMKYAEKTEPMSISEYWDGFWDLMEKYPMNTRTEYTDNEFAKALETYRNTDIMECIRSDDPIVRMFAILDRRVGKRTLEKIADNIDSEPNWLQEVYAFRTKKEMGNK